jgi:hypothetical protein
MTQVVSTLICQHLGKSVIDYVVISSDMFSMVTNFEVMPLDISDHFPITCIFDTPNRPACENIEYVQQVKYRWTTDTCKQNEFLSFL